MANKNEHMILV